MVKPLRDLIAEADRILGQTKTAASVVSDEVSSLADTLAFATAIEEQFALPGTNQAMHDPEFEKVAKAINKIAAKIEWEVLKKADQFEEAALANGYTEAQVEEALSKIAAAKIKSHLSTMVAMGQNPNVTMDANSLHTKKVKAVGEEKRSLPISRSFKGAE